MRFIKNSVTICKYFCHFPPSSPTPWAPSAKAMVRSFGQHLQPFHYQHIANATPKGHI